MSDSLGNAPKWWQWAVSGAMVVAGVALVATGVGGYAGGALICAGVNSVVGSYVSESSGGSSEAGWIGGMVTGAACGLGAGAAGELLLEASKEVGVACLGKAASSIGMAFSSGFAGSIAGQSISSFIDGKSLDINRALQTAATTGVVNCFSGIGSGIGNAIREMPLISTTTTTCANMLTAGWSILSEAASDFAEMVSGFFS